MPTICKPEKYTLNLGVVNTIGRAILIPVPFYCIILKPRQGISKAQSMAHVYAGIVEELYWYSYKLLIVDGGAPTKSIDEEEIVFLSIVTSSNVLEGEELEKAHREVYSYLGKKYDADMAQMYLVPNDRYSGIKPYPTMI